MQPTQHDKQHKQSNHANQQQTKPSPSIEQAPTATDTDADALSMSEIGGLGVAAELEGIVPRALTDAEQQMGTLRFLKSFRGRSREMLSGFLAMPSHRIQRLSMRKRDAVFNLVSEALGDVQQEAIDRE